MFDVAKVHIVAQVTIFFDNMSHSSQIEGRPIREYKGVVTGEVIIGANGSMLMVATSGKTPNKSQKIPPYRNGMEDFLYICN